MMENKMGIQITEVTADDGELSDRIILDDDRSYGLKTFTFKITNTNQTQITMSPPKLYENIPGIEVTFPTIASREVIAALGKIFKNPNSEIIFSVGPNRCQLSVTDELQLQVNNKHKYCNSRIHGLSVPSGGYIEGYSMNSITLLR